jgi:2,5-furandicarboxylate decarboxylase 1
MTEGSLRTFLAQLAKSGQLVDVAEAADPAFQLAALSRIALDRGGPALRFTNVHGHTMPVVTNLFATRDRFAAALGVGEAELHEQWSHRVRNPLEPEMVSTGPCKDVVLKGPDVDLGLLPTPTWNELDGGPYLSLPVQISKDPETGTRNAATYRVQVHDRTRLGMLFGPYRHLAMQRAKRPGQPFPIAIAMGLPPAAHIAAAAPLPYGSDELAVAGALQQERLQLVACETVPLEVPAEAEIVLEGFILPDELMPEGPYGEFTGFYGDRAPRPVVEVTCMTMRRDPILLAAYQGRPPQDSTLMQSIPAEAEIRRVLPLSGLRDIYITESGCGAFHAVVSVDKLCDGYGKMFGLSVLGTWGGRYIKQLTVVDSSIDPRNADLVAWAVATRVQPDRDIEILSGLVGIILDPSLPDSEKRSGRSRTSKMIIDATGYAEDLEPPRLCSPPAHAMEWAAKIADDILSR